MTPLVTASSSGKTLAILRAGIADAALAREAIIELQGRAPFDGASVVEFLSDPSRCLLLAIQDEQVAGILTGYHLQRPHSREPEFLLYDIDVRLKRRNQGIGKALVERFIAEARNAGASEIWVLTNQSNTAAMAIYAHCRLCRPNTDEVMLSLALNL